ncbi:INO80 complex subunit C [Bos mutus]|nr:INO80 complex subunit C [Bos mutus]
MAAQIPIVATTSTPGIARNSKKRPASPSHNGSSAGGYSASKKKKVSASGFAQVRCHSPNLRVRGSPHSLPLPDPRGSRAHARARVAQLKDTDPILFLFCFKGISMDGVTENKMVPSDFSTGPMEKAAKPLPFKDPNFVHSGHGGAVAGKKNRTWKNLKQILASERALPWQLNDPNYFSIDAPPSFKPAKKYSDVSGLLANYTDPQSKLRFSTIEEFSYIRRLPSDVVTGYLALRKATSIVP